MITVTCDGCGETAKEHTERGLVKKAHYCSECDVIYQEYASSRDRAHNYIQRHWKNAMATINRDFGARLNTLPDA